MQKHQLSKNIFIFLIIIKPFNIYFSFFFSLFPIVNLFIIKSIGVLNHACEKYLIFYLKCKVTLKTNELHCYFIHNKLMLPTTKDIQGFHHWLKVRPFYNDRLSSLN